MRADAHTRLRADYISRCVDVLATAAPTSWADRCEPVGTTAFGRAVAAVTTSPLGVGPAASTTPTEAQDVETVYLGTYRRAAYEVGGYDETGSNGRPRTRSSTSGCAAGRPIRLDPRSGPPYFPRQTPEALWRQYFNYGLCKASTLKKHRTLPYWRPLAPAAMMAVATAPRLGAGRPPAGPRASPRRGMGRSRGVVALRMGDQPGVAPHRAFAALAICHWGYGLGFWQGIGRILTGRPFDAPSARGR